MAKKPKCKLPSGSYRVQKYDYTDALGKKHYKSFTASTKKEAQLMADLWVAGKIQEEPENLTVYKSVKNYLDAKENVLSPSTMKNYHGLMRTHFTGELGAVRLKDLTNQHIQLWVNALCKKGLSPKTVRNAYGLLSASLEMFHPDFRLKVTLPARKKTELYTPSDEDIRKLLNHIQGTELEIAVYLAAFGPMRRGEICALESTDIHGSQITVSKSMVIGPDQLWHIKQPKTYSSYRTIDFPDFVIHRLAGINGRIVKCSPNAITSRFTRAVEAAELPHFRFHDLRHYSASIMHAIGVPDQYIMQRGGWASDNIMKSVYRNVIDLESARQSRKIRQHFESISHEVSHEGRSAQ